MNPKVSIIVPCYKVEKYLERCIKSLLSQSIRDIEIILVDDGSPDNVPLLCDKFAENDSRIKVIHKVNEGLGYARNAGLKIATGDYIAFVDSDDYVSKDMYLDLYNNAICNNADIVYCGFMIEYKTNKWKFSKEVSNKQSFEGSKIKSFLFDMIASDCKENKERIYNPSVWHAIYKSSVIKNNNISFLSERDVVSEDIAFHVDILSVAKKVVYIPNCYYFYCKNLSSLSNSFNINKYGRFKSLYFYINRKFLDDNEGEKRATRFFIGYTRQYIRNLLNSNVSNKKEILKSIVYDEIWSEISTKYPPKYFNFPKNLIHWLFLNKKIMALVFFIRIINIFHK